MSEVGSIESYVPESMPVAKITLSESGEYIILGNKTFNRKELQSAFGGNLNPGLIPYPKVNFNPAPLGLSAFAFTTFLLSLFNCRAMGITTPNVVVGAACMYGGAVQFLAGMWEFGAGNTFGFIALTSYGAFWMSFGAIYVPSFGIAQAYQDPRDLSNAVGFYLIGWAIFTFLLVLVTMKSTLAFFSLFFFLCLTYIFLAVGSFLNNYAFDRVGGILGVITAILGWYNALAGTAVRQNSYFTVKAIPLTRISS
jgi:succinate-acetate transporter protein